MTHGFRLSAELVQDDLLAARLHLMRLLERRSKALQVMHRLAGPNLDAASVLHWLGHTSCVVAMKSANEYVAAARTQMDRIEIAATSWDRGTDRARVFHEIHYYFICWDAVWKRLQVIKARAGFTSIKAILQKYRAEAEHYQMGRDQLEHYDDWLSGRPRFEPLAAWDHGNLHAMKEYSLAGRRWNVSRASLERLERIVREVAAAVFLEGRMKLIAQAMNP
jgi:hypothetical protein